MLLLPPCPFCSGRAGTGSRAGGKARSRLCQEQVWEPHSAPHGVGTGDVQLRFGNFCALSKGRANGGCCSPPARAASGDGDFLLPLSPCGWAPQYCLCTLTTTFVLLTQCPAPWALLVSLILECAPRTLVLWDCLTPLEQEQGVPRCHPQEVAAGRRVAHGGPRAP